jgi:hypothetical protein
MMTARNQPDNLDAYMDLGTKGIIRLVLLLLVEEGLSRELDLTPSVPRIWPRNQSRAVKNSASLGMT